ncbi:hypothetical protein B296_00042730 [Ensete ventricosum]|uniref:Superoxide dismutase copper/zinc binding domain-containing protein n=1 Tax=Ensete ventricosum TaxID=4639 RepID=A0A426XV27_ENSVE|nr:hypothetical protein B296_00042730 [Ensete ventricosum]
MQAILAAAMAAHTVLLSASSPAFLLPGFSWASPARPFHSAIVGQPLRPSSSAAKLVSTAAKPKPLVVVAAAAKKAVAVLKGNSSVEGVVTLGQEDNGLLLLWLSLPLYPFLLGIFFFYSAPPFLESASPDFIRPTTLKVRVTGLTPGLHGVAEATIVDNQAVTNSALPLEMLEADWHAVCNIYFISSCVCYLF